MFTKLIDLSVHNRLLVMLLLLGGLGYAVSVVPKLNLDAFPDVTNVQVTINTEAQGLASAEVEQLITYPIEAVMYSLPDVKEVRSISKTSRSCRRRDRMCLHGPGCLVSDRTPLVWGRCSSTF